MIQVAAQLRQKKKRKKEFSGPFVKRHRFLRFRNTLFTTSECAWEERKPALGAIFLSCIFPISTSLHSQKETLKNPKQFQSKSKQVRTQWVVEAEVATTVTSRFSLPKAVSSKWVCALWWRIFFFTPLDVFQSHAAPPLIFPEIRFWISEWPFFMGYVDVGLVVEMNCDSW